ncbi:MAG: hypothetical protein M3R62_13350 [Acidobacteriota bacterium]|nr:hypothetical protein [Acidobacteriota bacterium]
MLTILVVAPPGLDVDGLSALSPSVEILRARDAEEALEKLGRNRRVDAILLLTGEGDREILREIREENPAPPPVFLCSRPGGVPEGARELQPAAPAVLLERLLAAIE